MRAQVWACLLTIAMVFSAHAVQPDEVLSDTKLEQRARGISKDLRCLVCQNQSIDDSDAPLAKDLRVLVRDRLKAGDTDDAVLDFVVARYGEFVLLRPVFNVQNALLWTGPFLVLISGIFIVWRAAWRKGPAPMANLSDEEREALDRLMAHDAQKS